MDDMKWGVQREHLYGILSLYVTPIIGGNAVDSSNLDTFLSTAQPRSLRDRTEKHGAYDMTELLKTGPRISPQTSIYVDKGAFSC